MIVLGVSDDYPPGLLLGFSHSESVFAVSEGNFHFLPGPCFFNRLSGFSFLSMMTCADCNLKIQSLAPSEKTPRPVQTSE